VRIVLLTHPSFLNHQSMPRFTSMLAEGFRKKGHTVEICSPQPYSVNLPIRRINKWLGYIDQFLIFPVIAKRRIRKTPADMYVLIDHALGIWVPLLKDLPHIIVCHDFLAQRSAAGEVRQNPTGRAGRIFQRLIRNGYSRGSNFVSVSRQTQHDLHRFLGRIPAISKVIYNGLHKEFVRIPELDARKALSQKISGPDLSNGYVLHVGSDHWYKNRMGVVKAYNAWRVALDAAEIRPLAFVASASGGKPQVIETKRIPLLLIGSAPSTALRMEIESSPYKGDIFTLENIGDDLINAVYSGASVLFYPSLAEGFGWPIAEAMASGCPVITTAAAPMTEVGGDCATYIPVMPAEVGEVEAWASLAAASLDKVINLSAISRSQILSAGLNNVQRCFNTQKLIDEYEDVFYHIVSEAQRKPADLAVTRLGSADSTLDKERERQ